MKVLMVPSIQQMGPEESGIKRVVEAYTRYLGGMGVEFVSDGSYDVKAAHAGSVVDADVAHCHGLYWTGDYPAALWEWKANAMVTMSMRNAKAVTVPTHWVAETFQRDMRLTPHVVPHGIEWGEWQHSEESEGYVLWNKNRIGDVCDAESVAQLSALAPSTQFVTTFMPRTSSQNVRAIGVRPHGEMKRIIQRAGIYLATTKETFGIGILEAMASGIPVLGYAHGGIIDLVQHGINGYLARPGDVKDLEQGLRYCLEHRDTLGNNGRELAKGFSWGKTAEQVYAIYEGIMHPDPPSASIVIPSYNYGDKVERAINSALAQTKYLHEVIVVDDGSNDGGLTRDVVSAISEKDRRVLYFRKENGGVATARNYGISATISKYICCLDADDAIEPNFLETLIPPLEKESGLGITYSGLRYILPDGRTGISDWPSGWDFQLQLKRQNQIPTCCVFRREMWARLGGYKQRYAPQGQGAEDAEFWLRAGAYGWRAEKVTDDPLFIYSWMTGRASGNKDYKEVDWLELHPWARDANHPFASYALPEKWSHPVRQYDEPVVSVIIPVGSGHEELLMDALDSLESQTYKKWEVIVVWDGKGEPKDCETDYPVAYPYVRWVVTDGEIGAGAARNLGAKIARGNMLLFLDADDFLLPNFIERAIRVYESTGSATYSDYEGWAIVDDISKLAKDLRENIKGVDKGITRIGYRAAEFDCDRAQRQPENNSPYLWCDINTLHPKSWYNEIGGFDESLSSWEDVDYWWRMARAGHCFQRIPQELFIYRFNTGKRREKGLDTWQNLLGILKEKYSKEAPMGCSGCGKKSAPQINKAAVDPNIAARSFSGVSDSDLVMIVYQSPNIGDHPVVGNATKQFYGYRGRGEEFLVHKADIAAKPNVFVILQPANRVNEPAPLAPPPPRALERAMAAAGPNDVVVAPSSFVTVPPAVLEMQESTLNSAIEEVRKKKRASKNDSNI